jgi:hypothetical protein
MTYKKLLAAADRLYEEGFQAGTCFMCHGSATITGFFEMDRKFAKRLRTKEEPGIFIYGVCEACFQAHGKAGVAKKVEALLLSIDRRKAVSSKFYSSSSK